MERVDQQEIVAAFERGEITKAPVLKRIDTPLSHIFLSGAHAYKLKRAVRLPFVDFTSMERRRDACGAELRVNHALAGALYLEVATITREDGGFALGGSGEIVDHVVVMRRFDQAQQFDELARANALSLDLLQRTAARIASFHASAPRRRDAGHVADYRGVISNLRKTEGDGAARLGLVAAAPVLFDELEGALVRNAALIERRRATGHVRRVHGDLHLRNICLFEGEPTPFDALEFDDRLASIDVVYDLCFLLMDLRKAGLPLHANVVMNAYWDRSDETEEALGLIGVFSALRAAVRMAVAVAAGELGEAQVYRALGLDLLRRQAPLLVAIGGLSGAGKSAVARALGPHLPGPTGARVLRSDIVRKGALGVASTEKAPADAYTPEARRRVYRALVERARAATSQGVSAIVDATFADERSRRLLDALEGRPPRRFWLTAPVGVRVARVTARRGDASDADAAIASSQREPPDLGADWEQIDADRPVDVVARDILGRLDKSRRTASDA